MTAAAQVERAAFQIIQGDALEVLRTLPAESIHCVVTSPPYYGLRDYKTGRWEGGSADCDHKQHRGSQGNGQRADRSHPGQAPYKGVCGKCGAVRIDQQIGLEDSIEEYLAKLVDVFREVKRVLRRDGSAWVNMGDSYCSDAGKDRKPTTLAGPRVPSSWTNRSQPTRIHAARKGNDCDPKRGPAADGAPLQAIRRGNGLKPKDLAMMPARLALALQADGWFVRAEIIWEKASPMPESVLDRPTRSHEYIYLLSRSSRYYYDPIAILESSTGRRSGNKERKYRDDYGGAERSNVHQGFGFPYESNGTRNARSVWKFSSEPTKLMHYATFPTKLAARCIAAGTSQRGVCPSCGAPWSREVQRDFIPQEDVCDEQRPRGSHGQKSMPARNGWQGVPRGSVDVSTIGWRPACRCIGAEDFKPVSATVLDPFAGLASTGIAAVEHGRRFIGIELSAEYVKLAWTRAMERCPLLVGETV